MLPQAPTQLQHPELWGSAQGRPRGCWCHRELVLFAELPCVFLLGKWWAGTGAGLSLLPAQGTTLGAGNSPVQCTLLL